MPIQLQVTKITRNGRISLGRVIPAMDAQVGDVVQIVMNDDGSFKISKVEA
ncbi:MAG TPA: hypothetical protein PKM11_05365 [Methanomassiliicoccales archaeon]|nr:hypothetical protein [Methanomassiliicoccales archaeon]